MQNLGNRTTRGTGEHSSRKFSPDSACHEIAGSTVSTSSGARLVFQLSKPNPGAVILSRNLLKVKSLKLLGSSAAKKVHPAGNGTCLSNFSQDGIKYTEATCTPTNKPDRTNKNSLSNREDPQTLKPRPVADFNSKCLLLVRNQIVQQIAQKSRLKTSSAKLNVAE